MLVVLSIVLVVAWACWAIAKGDGKHRPCLLPAPPSALVLPDIRIRDMRNLRKLSAVLVHASDPAPVKWSTKHASDMYAAPMTGGMVRTSEPGHARLDSVATASDSTYRQELGTAGDASAHDADLHVRSEAVAQGMVGNATGAARNPPSLIYTDAHGQTRDPDLLPLNPSLTAELLQTLPAFPQLPPAPRIVNAGSVAVDDLNEPITTPRRAVGWDARSRRQQVAEQRRTQMLLEGAQQRASSPTLDIVVARYGESCMWLLEPPFSDYVHHVIIYNKGPRPVEDAVARRVRAVVTLPNVGRCDHTFLYHIMSRLLQDEAGRSPQPGSRAEASKENGTRHAAATPAATLHHGRSPESRHMPDLTIFLTGSMRELPHKMEQALHIFQSLPDVPSSWPHVNILDTVGTFKLEKWVASDRANSQLNPETRLFPAPYRPFRSWFRHTFGDDAVAIGPLVLFGVCIGKRDNLASLPLHVYARMLQQVSVHSNPEVGHYIERVLGTLCMGKVFRRSRPAQIKRTQAEDAASATLGTYPPSSKHKVFG